MSINFSRLYRIARVSVWKVRKYVTKNKKPFTISFYVFLGIVGAQLLFILMIYAGLLGKLPSKSELKSIHHPVASEVYSADSVLMGKYYIQNRQDLKPHEIPSILRDALIATEDIRFYEHNGIDIRSLERVLVKTLLLRNEGSGGGSTITQQLAKNLYPRTNYRFFSLPINKFREMFTALRIEKLYTKDEIIELYLNTVPFGENTYGIKSASLRYFNKVPLYLQTEEAAMLIGMLKATNIYNPHSNYDRALLRRNVVLSQMAKYKYIDTTLKDSLQRLPIELDYVPLPHYAGIAPYFREFLRGEMEEWCEDNLKDEEKAYNLYTDGLKIYTTIDSRLQKYAEGAVAEHMAYLQGIFNKYWSNRDLWKGNPEIEKELIAKYVKGEHADSLKKIKVFSWEGDVDKEMNILDSLKYYLQFLQTGVLSMDPKTGEIKVWIGGINHKYFQYDHVMAKRQVGSTFKPLVYLSALENGILPCDFFANDSIVYEEYDNWRPENADHKYGGYYSLKGALTHSVNTVSVNLLMKTGYSNVLRIGKASGINSEMPEVPSLALGTADISLLEMVNAYQAIADKGMFHKRVYIKRIEDKDGKILFQAEPEPDGERIAEEKNVEILIEMMRNVVNQGTAGALRYRYHLYSDIAGKTGTTQNHADGWYIGFTPSLVTGVWVGGEYQNIRFASLKYGQGTFTALPIWAKFMQRVYKDEDFSHLRNDSFRISDEAKQMLDCEDFRDNKPFEFKPIITLKKLNLFKRIFNRTDHKKDN